MSQRDPLDEPIPINPVKQRNTWRRPAHMPPESIRNLRALARYTSGVVVAVVRSPAQQELPENQRFEPAYIVEMHVVARIDGKRAFRVVLEMHDVDLDGLPLPATVPPRGRHAMFLLHAEDILKRGRFVGRFERERNELLPREHMERFIHQMDFTRNWLPGEKRILPGDSYAEDGTGSDLDDEPTEDRMTDSDGWAYMNFQLYHPY